MTRRQKRFARRMAKRKQKQDNFYSQFTYDKIYDFGNLCLAIDTASKGVRWKGSVQNYIIGKFIKAITIQEDLLERKDMTKGFTCFDVNERGKVRHIRAVKFYERVVQKCLCQQVLYPICVHSTIYDNGANIKGKGQKFALDRMTKHLTRFYKKYGNNGYILQIDFSKYFDNINHNKLKEMIGKHIKDKDLINLSNQFIDSFGEIGLGLGSETSQTEATVFPNRIDHKIKEYYRIKGYGRYMDDSYLISNSKEELKRILTELQPLFDEYGIKINRKKTKISKLNESFVWLKTRFRLLDNGKILKLPCRKSIIREKHKIKKHLKLGFDIHTIIQSYQSWRGSMIRKHSRKSVYKVYERIDKWLKKKEN